MSEDERSIEPVIIDFEKRLIQHTLDTEPVIAKITLTWVDGACRAEWWHEEEIDEPVEHWIVRMLWEAAISIGDGHGFDAVNVICGKEE